MSGPALLRRRSSRQGLETLLRLTAQWRVEDEEEAARERRRRERDQELRTQGEAGGGQERPEQEKLLGLKTPEAPEVDEDEGFGDWSQKAEPRQPPWGPGVPGSVGDGAEAPRGGSPAGQEQEDASHQRALELEDGEGLCPAEVPLDKLCLSPEPELQEGLGPEGTEPDDPEDTTQDHLEPAEAREADEGHLKCRQSKTPSPLVLEGAAEESPPPLSPTTKLTDRTESLNRCIKKSNSVKKSQPALPISKIDERLEQYTQAIETAGRTPKLVHQPSIELPSMAVASTKSRWETGELQAQATTKAPSCKDIVAGDMSKRCLWEQKSGSKSSSTVKSTPSGKRYKFVATGHGKYEKVLMEEGAGP